MAGSKNISKRLLSSNSVSEKATKKKRKEFTKEENVHTDIFHSVQSNGSCGNVIKTVCVVCYCGFKKMECISQSRYHIS